MRIWTWGPRVQIQIKHLCWNELYTVTFYLNWASFIILLNEDLQTLHTQPEGLLEALTPCSGPVRQRPWKGSDGRLWPSPLADQRLIQDIKTKLNWGQGTDPSLDGDADRWPVVSAACSSLHSVPTLPVITHPCSSALPPLVPVAPHLTQYSSDRPFPIQASKRWLCPLQSTLLISKGALGMASGKGRYRNGTTEPVLKGMARRWLGK